jgi:hypothetical protein
MVDIKGRGELKFLLHFKATRTSRNWILSCQGVPDQSINEIMIIIPAVVLIVFVGKKTY